MTSRPERDDKLRVVINLPQTRSNDESLGRDTVSRRRDVSSEGLWTQKGKSTSPSHPPPRRTRVSRKRWWGKHGRLKETLGQNKGKREHKSRTGKRTEWEWNLCVYVWIKGKWRKKKGTVSVRRTFCSVVMGRGDEGWNKWKSSYGT